MAEEMGVDISTVSGTGPNGRITAADVTNAASGAAPAKKAAAPAKPRYGDVWYFRRFTTILMSLYVYSQLDAGGWCRRRYSYGARAGQEGEG